MPRDSNQVFTLPEAAFQPNTLIQPGAMNNNFADVAQALTDSLTRGETTTYTRTLLDDADAATARNTLGVAGVYGLRNLIINGNPLVNQRNYVSGTPTTVANQYTLDRWRVVVSGQAVSWSDSVGVRTVTAPAGGMEQVIEGQGLIGGTYTLSWTGTATATVNSNAVANGGQVTLTGGADVTVRMSGGTWNRLQLEPGSIATPFEPRPVALDTALCQRYFYRLERDIRLGGTMLNGVGASTFVPVQFPARMRVAPTASGVSFTAGTGNASQGVESINRDGFEVRLTANGVGNGGFIITLSAGASFSAEF